MTITPHIDINIAAEGWQRFDGLEALAAAAILISSKVSAVSFHPDAEVSLMLCDDAAIRVLNRNWRKIDKPTNVLSFPGRGSPVDRVQLGDIAIAYETTAAEAMAEGKTFPAHFTHLVVHGFLHLLGMDHETVQEAESMEAVERRILAELGVADPYHNTIVEEALESR